jgi:hypothetical protein
MLLVNAGSSALGLKTSISLQTVRFNGRSRNAGHPAPPAQIRGDSSSMRQQLKQIFCGKYFHRFP